MIEASIDFSIVIVFRVANVWYLVMGYTVHPKKYVHGSFIIIVAVKYWPYIGHIHQDYFTGSLEFIQTSNPLKIILTTTSESNKTW